MSVVSAKEQVTIPKAVLEALGLKAGDLVSLELEGAPVRLRLVSGGDQAYPQSLQSGLTEWASEADEAAFADL
ncbi:AbrB/MazE/SpoVT family DNA-binding domain-containing protein [Parasynechococcus marenigrum]|uniref:AbrB/MazE/SpoVT family DNA-binding domain-containing protein n=1 Tax=Parasynechococcus marenigrum TaxID=2881428 RepID=UPI00130523B2|nr:AbrB/MazE/SpoVT family DNA-binding domain-containing protein [Parasynechococcus marenigrum]